MWAKNGEAFLYGFRTYARNNIGFNRYFTNLSTLRANQKLWNAMLLIARDLRTNDVFTRCIELMDKVLCFKEIEYSINRHRLNVLRKVVIAVVN
ncbi:hypothetical protein VAL01S_27_00410 [Vibrio alginolyticus NBRC 15630 = ATCC 17749]|nr:hypothetical protein YZOS03_39450 [Vibrio alginolyticus]GAD73599.1 hypothetical protein VAL01S_27_00410 [Vibrio alginolyticus NBRC 15630 = ATCC 17749]